MYNGRLLITSELFPEMMFSCSLSSICHQSLPSSPLGAESSAVALCFMRPGANLNLWIGFLNCWFSVILLCILKVQAFWEEIEDICDEPAVLRRVIPFLQTLLKKALCCPTQTGLVGTVFCGVGIITLRFCMLSIPGTGYWSGFWSWGR